MYSYLGRRKSSVTDMKARVEQNTLSLRDWREALWTGTVHEGAVRRWDRVCGARLQGRGCRVSRPVCSEPPDKRTFPFTLPPSRAGHSGSRRYRMNCRNKEWRQGGDSASGGDQSPHQCPCAIQTLCERWLVTGSAGPPKSSHLTQGGTQTRRKHRGWQPLGRGQDRQRAWDSNQMACSRVRNMDARETLKESMKAELFQREKTMSAGFDQLPWGTR